MSKRNPPDDLDVQAATRTPAKASPRDRLIPLAGADVPLPLALALPLLLSACIAVAATERSGASRWPLALFLTLVLFPGLGHGLTWARSRIRNERWGRAWWWCLSGLGTGLLLAPGSGIQGGPSDALWWAKVVVLGALSVGVVLAFASIPEFKDAPAARRLILGCGAAYALCALMWLLAYWPGVMTVDSVGQWKQMLSGRLSNEHPVFHTAFFWLTSLGGRSPALVAGAQILLLAASLCFCLSEFAKAGVPRAVLVGLTALYCLMPANLLLAITLWKDIPFTALTMILSALMLRLGRTKGASLRSPGFLVALTITSASLCLLRHNGVLIIAGLTVLLPVALPRGLRLRAFGSSALAIGVYFVVSGPLYQFLGIEKATRAYMSAIPIHQVGAVAHAYPRTFDLAERDLLVQLQPFSTWQHDYNCFSINPLLHAVLDKDRFEQLNDQFLSLWVDVALEHPDALIRHQACVSSMVWAVRRKGGYLYLGERGIVANGSGLVSAPKLGTLRGWTDRYLDWTAHRSRTWWTWGTGLFLYLSLAIAVSTVLRTRSGWTALFVAPAVLSSLGLILVNVAQDFRYMYPMYVVGTLSLALPFVLRTLRPEAKQTP